MNKSKKSILPKLRFLQFKDSPAWNIYSFGKLIIPVNDRAGIKKYTLMSVTSGVGLVPQIEKFGREIAGNAYSSYYVIKKNDFGYNKSATKQFPEGYISMLTEYEEAALPNSIFTCFRIIDEGCVPQYFDHLFHNNYHGSWLRKYIEVGARAHGSLSVDTKHLWAMPIALPQRDEQQKIADCLSSLDDLIAAEDKKLEALKAHKKGLMQKLFPAEDKTVPEWRFPGFVKRWESTTFDVAFAFHQTNTFSRNQMNTKKGKVRNIHYGDVLIKYGYVLHATSSIPFINDNVALDKYKNSSYLKNGDIVIADTAEDLTAGKAVEIQNVDCEILSGLHTMLCRPIKQAAPGFWGYYINSPVFHNRIIPLIAGVKVSSISKTNISKTHVAIPDFSEQKKIADCLSSIDDLIAEQTQKIESLKTHKKGLMQGLFPSIKEVDE